MIVDVVVCGDRRILWGMAVAVRSALENSTIPFNISVISDGFSASDKDRLRRSWSHENCAEIRFADISSERIRRFRSTLYLKSKSAYSRYYIADLFPEIRRAIYLDTDLLVHRDLAEAARLDLQGNWAAAVRDVSVRKRPSQPALRDRLGVKDESRYFNSGFLILDMDAWKANDLTRKIIDLSIDKAEILHSQDQDALNIILEDNVLLLDAGWNTSQYEKPAPLDGRVVHLIGTIKPWHARYKGKFIDPYYRGVHDRFYEALDRTEFRGERPWDPAGLGRLKEYVDSKTPTADMIAPKLTRYFSAPKTH